MQKYLLISKKCFTFAAEISKKQTSTITEKKRKNMIGKKYDAQQYTVRLKATIQSTGRLGFTYDTMEQLKLTTDCSIYLAPDDSSKKIMYMGVVRERKEDAFPVLSAGKYVYLNTRQLFETLGVDFTTYVNFYDLARFEEGDEAMEGECYKMSLRNRLRTSEDKE